MTTKLLIGWGLLKTDGIVRSLPRSRVMGNFDTNLPKTPFLGSAAVSALWKCHVLFQKAELA